MAKFYITNAIPYVNGKPHIGHALEFTQSDTIARYHRILGDDVLLLCGGDENALKNVQAAEAVSTPIQQFIDTNEQAFFDLSKKLHIQFDVWQKGSSKNHHLSSQKLWELCDKNGDIYKKRYKGLYCVGCERFYTKEELDEKGECYNHPGKKVEEVEEEKEQNIKTENGRPMIHKRFIKMLRLDNAVGMLFSEFTTWSIIIVGATVLHSNGITNIGTAADAAKALEPLVTSFPNAGFLAKFIFATGIIGLGLLSIPVLSGSAAYALSEAFNWKASLDYKLKKAYGFYGIITVATVVGLMINFIGIDPVQALVYAAVLNGIIAVPLIFLIFKIANNEKVMGNYKSKKLSNVFVGLTFIGMLLSAILLLITFLR
jgi:hypothetical protein